MVDPPKCYSIHNLASERKESSGPPSQNFLFRVMLTEREEENRFNSIPRVGYGDISFFKSTGCPMNCVKSETPLFSCIGKPFYMVIKWWIQFGLVYNNHYYMGGPILLCKRWAAYFMGSRPVYWSKTPPFFQSSEEKGGVLTFFTGFAGFPII